MAGWWWLHHHPDDCGHIVEVDSRVVMWLGHIVNTYGSVVSGGYIINAGCHCCQGIEHDACPNTCVAKVATRAYIYTATAGGVCHAEE